jgi:uncharacterized membrane protein YjfL (UPF0719 family)
MGEFNLWNIVVSLVAYVVGVLLCAGPMVFANLWWLSTGWTKKVDKEKLLQAGHLSFAIQLGTTFVCQAILIRHAVYVVTEVVRNLIFYKYSLSDAAGLLGRSLLFVALITGLALLSVWLAEKAFKRLTGELKEDEEIERGNLAVSVFSALVILAITIILNEGVQDLAHSLILLGRNTTH